MFNPLQFKLQETGLKHLILIFWVFSWSVFTDFMGLLSFWRRNGISLLAAESSDSTLSTAC